MYNADRPPAVHQLGVALPTTKMMSQDVAVTKFSEIFTTMQKYMDGIVQMKDFGYVMVEAVIDVYHLGTRKTETLALEKTTYSENTPMTLYYVTDQHNHKYNAKEGRYVDGRWKCSVPVVAAYCPITETFEHAVILGISYNISSMTPLNHMLESRSKCQPQHLIVMLWKHISRSSNFYCASIYHNNQGGASIHYKDDKYECTLDGSTLKSMRDLRDYLDGAKISITMTDGSKEYGYVNDLYTDNILALADKFTETVDGGVVQWNDGKWCDEEYHTTHTQ